MMGIASWLTGKRGVSLPFTDECAPLCTDANSFNHLFTAAQAHGRARAWKNLEFRGASSHFAAQPSYQPSTSFWGHRLTLGPDEPALFSRLDSSTRRAIRKAEQNNLHIEVSTSLAAMETFYRLMCQTRQRHGVPPQPWSFFKNIHQYIIAAGSGCIVLARQAATAVAGAVFLHSGNTALYKFGASDETQQQLRANNLVMWTGIKWHAARNFTSLDFGRTSLDNEGLRRFKQGWGTEEYRIDYSKLDLSTGRYVTAQDRASGWHTKIFQKMPIPLARLVGAVLYRHIG